MADINNPVKINIPAIPKVVTPNIPKFNDINVNVDTSKIESTVNAALANKEKLDRACLFAQLSCFKVKTVSISDKPVTLTEEDRIGAQKIIDKLVANNWLDETNKNWAIENGITVA